MLFVNPKRLRTSADVEITALAMANGVAVNGESIKVERNVGFGILTLKEDKAGGMGDLDVYVEYSDDNVTWNRVYTTALGVLTQSPNVVTTLQNVTRRIAFQVFPAKWMRFVFDPDADSQTTADFTFQEET